MFVGQLPTCVSNSKWNSLATYLDILHEGEFLSVLLVLTCAQVAPATACIITCQDTIPVHCPLPQGSSILLPFSILSRYCECGIVIILKHGMWC